MKLTLVSKTFAAWSFRCTTLTGLAGPDVLGPYWTANAQAACAGAEAGEHFPTGATIGQDYHPGTVAGLCNG
jgi:hypothetical protein